MRRSSHKIPERRNGKSCNTSCLNRRRTRAHFVELGYSLHVCRGFNPEENHIESAHMGRKFRGIGPAQREGSGRRQEDAEALKLSVPSLLWPLLDGERCFCQEIPFCWRLVARPDDFPPSMQLSGSVVGDRCRN